MGRRLFKPFIGPWKPDASRKHHTRLYRIAHGFYFFMRMHGRRGASSHYLPPPKIPIIKMVFYPCSGNRIEAPSDELTAHWDNVEERPRMQFAPNGMPLL